MLKNIPLNLKDFDKLILDPFCIFEKKNFLEQEFYDSLRNNFPQEELFEGYHENGKKIFLNNRQDKFFEFLKSNTVWSNFYKSINNKTFTNFMIKLINEELKKIEDRKNIKNFFFHKKYHNNLNKRFLRKIIKLLNFKNIRLGFEFSIIKQECFIPPHCDTENKLLSLMIYFPPQKKEQNLNFIENLGTNFFKINENFDKKLDSWKSKYLNAEDANIFYKNYNKFYHSKFEENKLIGFIKNNKSWHDVTMFKENFLRRSININIFLI
tara:strand:+ start:257 stop:1057 length:801 start_codon:yes stop_codon:yes gene_type:complete